MKLQWQISSKYIKSKRKESFISFVSTFSMIGIMLGVAVLIIVMSVMNGFRKDIVRSLIGINSHIYVSNYSEGITNYQSVIDKLKSAHIKDIVGISPSISQQALMSYGRYSMGLMVSGLRFEDIKNRSIIYNSILSYDLQGFKEGKNVVLLGKPLAESLGISIGDSVSFISPNGYVTIFGSTPTTGVFKVIGLVNTGLYQYDSSLAIIPFQKAQSFFMFNDNQAEKLEILIKNPHDAQNVAETISKVIPNYSIQTWISTNHYLINALNVERNVMFLILSLVILIATFNIVSSLVMLVRSKTKEIAILKTMGLSQCSIVMIFIFIGIRIGLKGTIWGGILGCILALNLEKIKQLIESITGVNLFPAEVYFLSQLPSDVQSLQVVFILIISFSFSVLASIYPSLKAAKIKPVEGLKYE